MCVTHTRRALRQARRVRDVRCDMRDAYATRVRQRRDARMTTEGGGQMPGKPGTQLSMSGIPNKKVWNSRLESREFRAFLSGIRAVLPKILVSPA